MRTKKDLKELASLTEDDLDGVHGGISWRDRFPAPNAGAINQGSIDQGFNLQGFPFGLLFGGGPQGGLNFGGLNLGGLGTSAPVTPPPNNTSTLFGPQQSQFGFFGGPPSGDPFGGPDGDPFGGGFFF